MATQNHPQKQRDKSGAAFALRVTASGNLAGLLNQHRFLAGYGIMILSTLFLIPALNAGMQGDVNLYQSVANDLFAGKMPYRDRVVEYPPYAIPIFLLPRIFGEGNYLAGFVILALLADWGVKLLLFAVGSGKSDSTRSLLPLILYCAATPFLRFFLLQRYDIFPALLCLFAVWAFCSGKPALCGFAIALGIGVKLYPIIFAPPLFVLAVRQKRWKPFAWGMATGLLPLVLLGFYLPWWRFAAFHAARGLQVESLYASLLWLGKLLGWTQANWEYTQSWYEVHGTTANAVLPWARMLFVGATGISTAVAVWAASRTKTFTISRLARLLLVPLLGFVIFNQVLSPQYLVWLLPLAALAALEGELWPVLAVVLAAMLTPAIYPSFHGDYYHGLNLIETGILLSRNLLLAAAWIRLLIY